MLNCILWILKIYINLIRYIIRWGTKIWQQDETLVQYNRLVDLLELRNTGTFKKSH
jgi:hypothetical protein